MLPTFCKDVVTRVRPATVKSRGSDIPDWANASKRGITGCSMQPASTSLSEDGRVLGITDMYTLYAPPNADIEVGDHILYNGKEYEIDGDIRVYPGVLRLAHIEVTLRRYNG